MSTINPIALATDGIICTPSKLEPIALATGILCAGAAVAPSVLPAVWRMWTGGIGIDMYGRYDRG